MKIKPLKFSYRIHFWYNHQSNSRNWYKIEKVFRRRNYSTKWIFNSLSLSNFIAALVSNSFEGALFRDTLYTQTAARAFLSKLKRDRAFARNSCFVDVLRSGVKFQLVSFFFFFSAAYTRCAVFQLRTRAPLFVTRITSVWFNFSYTQFLYARYFSQCPPPSYLPRAGTATKLRAILSRLDLI